MVRRCAGKLGCRVMRRVAVSLLALAYCALFHTPAARCDEPDSARVARPDTARAAGPDSVRIVPADSTRTTLADTTRAAPRDSVHVAPGSSRVSRADTATAGHGIRDTVTVLPPVRISGSRSATPGRSTATVVLLERSRLTRFLPLQTGDALLSGAGLNGVRGHGAQTSLLGLDDLEEVEIMPGSNSTLYGSDALGGAIDFVTQQSLFADRLGGSATASARAAAPGDNYGETVRARL